MSSSTEVSSCTREALSACVAVSEPTGWSRGATFSFSSALKAIAGSASGFLFGVFEALLEWQERSRQRRMLMGLDDRMLRDIGVTRLEAETEYRKPAWRP